MRKIFALLFTLLILFSLCSCGAKEDDKEHVEWLDDIPEPLPAVEIKVPEEMYGIWEAVKVTSIDGSFTESALEGMLNKMKENKTVFKLELGDTCYLLNADEEGNYVRDQEIELDFEQGIAFYKETKQRIAPIQYEDGVIYVTDTTNNLHLLFEKTE